MEKKMCEICTNMKCLNILLYLALHVLREWKSELLHNDVFHLIMQYREKFLKTKTDKLKYTNLFFFKNTYFIKIY